jgi:hypothetical protein
MESMQLGHELLRASDVHDVSFLYAEFLHQVFDGSNATVRSVNEAAIYRAPKVRLRHKIVPGCAVRQSLDQSMRLLLDRQGTY